jgi:hypothetical protein
MASWLDVVTRDRWWRWLTVALGAAVLLTVPAVGRRLPATENPVDAGTLRDRILASAGQPYSGYAQSVGQLGVPALPQLDQVAALLSGTIRMRVWYAAPGRWRVDELGTAGEHDTYHRSGTEFDDATEFVWDYEDDRLTRIAGQTPVRVPMAADLLPPELARRMLALAADDRVTRLPARRVAGVAAAGLRLSPSDPDTTVGSIDVWADPATGLPLQVQVTARGADHPVLMSRLLEVSIVAPPEQVLVPPVGAGSAGATVSATDVAGVLRGLGGTAPPRQLIGRALVTPSAELPVVGLYGSGLSGFVVVPLGRRLATELLDGAGKAGGVAINVPNIATAMRLQTPLVTLVVVRVRRFGYLLAGAVTAPVLDRAVAELVGGSS